MEGDDCCDPNKDKNYTISSSETVESYPNKDLSLGEESEFNFFFGEIDSLILLTLDLRNITKLVVIGQPIECIDGLNNLEQLKELWIAECYIQKIENLDSCSNLEKLYLYSNRITQIEGLDHLKKLQILCLSGNRITEIMNISKLEELKEMYLSQNEIKRIGTSIVNNKNLKTLNLSGNPIYNINDILHLPEVECLKFFDSVYEACPITSLCNYRCLIVLQMPTLKFLDSFEVDEEERTNTLDFFHRKIIYYNTFQEQLKYKYYCALYNKEKDCYLRNSKYKESLYWLKVEEIQSNKNNFSSTGDEPNTFIRANQESIWFQIRNWSFQTDQEKSLLWQKYKIHESQINMELRHGGNIRFKRYTMEQITSNNFQKLMDSFNCQDIFNQLEISSVKVTDVTEIINKGLQQLHQYLSKATHSMEISWKYYLLSGFHDAKGMNLWPFSIAEHGFLNLQDTGIEVTNCIAISDYEWLLSIKKKYDTSFGYHGLQANGRRTAVLIKTQIENLSPESPEELYLCHENEKKYSTCCSSFKVKHKDLLIPVFVIEYEYVFKECIAINEQQLDEAHELCSFHKNLRSQITKLEILNINYLSLKFPEDSWSSLSKLSLQACGIETIGILPCLLTIRSIDLSYNKLLSLAGLDSFPNIIDFDASFNNICTIADIAMLKKLKKLDISWNCLGSTFSVLRTLKRCAPCLQHLEMNFNPITDVKDIDHIIHLAREDLPTLNQINGKLVEHKVNVIRSTKQLSPTINQHSINDQFNKPYITTLWKSNQLYHSLACRDSITLEKNNECICIVWKNKGIDSVNCEDELNKLKWANLDNNFIMNIDFLQQSLFLEELSISHNILKAINESLLNLNRLVKLDLSNNYISSISCLSKSYFPSLEVFIKLKSLRFDEINCNVRLFLTLIYSLQVFNISNNLLINLSGIEACPALTELYSYHNYINTLEDLYYIKVCVHLVAVDFSSNKAENAENFKTFIYFHLPMIEVINGQCVKKSQIKEVNMSFGHCLDQSYFIKQNKFIEANLITELTLDNCSFKKIDLKARMLPNLISLDLSNNKITSLWGLHELPKLQTLCLSYNYVTNLTNDKHILQSLSERNATLGKEIHQFSSSQHHRIISIPFFPELKTLYLNNNGIYSLISLYIERMENLQSLFLNGNKLSCIKGIRNAEKLKHFVLDGNRIEIIDQVEMSSMANLQDLYLENNRIKELSFVTNLKSLRRLFLSKNRINEYEQFKHLECLQHLEEITLHGNPLLRKIDNYCLLQHALPSIKRIDGLFLNLESDKIEKSD